MNPLKLYRVTGRESALELALKGALLPGYSVATAYYALRQGSASAGTNLSRCAFTVGATFGVGWVATEYGADLVTFAEQYIAKFPF